MRLRVVGDGPLQLAMQRRMNELGLQGCVDVLGVQPPEAVAEWMRQSRCLLLPSRIASDGDAEGAQSSFWRRNCPVCRSSRRGMLEFLRWFWTERRGCWLKKVTLQDWRRPWR